MWRTVGVVLGAAVLVTAGAVTVSALAAPAGGGTVYIATGENFPDAVTAGAAGGAADGPVLLVRQNSIPSPTLDEVNRLQPFLVVIVGGTGVISQGVEDQLKALSFGPVVVRKGGADRYETAALLSQDTFPKTGGASCPPVGFLPAASTSSWSGVFRRTAVGGVYCELQLPDRATITKLTGTIDDEAVSAGSLCLLWRIDITGGSFSLGAGNTTQLAATPSSVGDTGVQVLTTTVIANPVVSNKRYGYWVHCGAGTDRSVVGVAVEYELTG